MKVRLHQPPLGPLGPMMYPPAGLGDVEGGICCQGRRLTPLNIIAQGGGIPNEILVTGCGALDPPTPPYSYSVSDVSLSR